MNKHYEYNCSTFPVTNNNYEADNGKQSSDSYVIT